MLDVDYFKAFNDGYGYPESDVCLRRVAAALAGYSHPLGMQSSRDNGEEFAVIPPSVELEQAISMAAMACTALRHLEIAHHVATRRRGRSVGVATTIHADVPALLKAAGTALYVAKALIPTV